MYFLRRIFIFNARLEMDTMDPLQTAQRHAGDCRTILKIKTLEDWNNWPTDDVSRKNNKNNEKTLTEQIHDMTCKGKHQHCKYQILPEYEISFRFGGKFHFNLELFFTQVFAIAEDAAGWFLNCRYQSGLEWSRLARQVSPAQAAQLETSPRAHHTSCSSSGDQIFLWQYQEELEGW